MRLDFNTIFVSARLDEIVGGLATQPELGIGPTCRFETDRHFG